MYSVSDKKWQIKDIDNQKILQLMQQYNLNEVTSRILINNNIPLNNISSFLNPKLKELMPDPYLLKDMDKAVERVFSAIKSNEKICVFGDYDVDGATSSALIKSYLGDLGINVSVYIPDRILEGYGPSESAMKKIKNAGNNLVITVDCGTLSFDALSAAKKIGLDAIVIDHHLGSETLPEAIAIINPNRLDEDFEYNNMAAVGVSFLFLVALQKKISSIYEKLPNLLSYLDLVALGTVCDVMPLKGLNRAFVKQGLKVMSKRNRLGLNILSDVSAIKEEITAYSLGFVLGPRINAGGRVGEASLGSKLLTETDYSKGLEYAQKLDKFNSERKEIEAKMLDESLDIAEKQKDNNIIFVQSKKFHQGVIGIIASRIKEKFHKPAAVIAIENGIGKASCRSITGVDLGAKIVEAKLQNILLAGGGHQMAAGFSIEENKIDELYKFLNTAIEPEMKNTADPYLQFYDFEVSVDGANIELIDSINSLSPFGTGFPEPIAKISDLFVLKARVINNKHVSCMFASDRNAYGSKALQAIAFNVIDTKIGDILMSPIPHKISVIGTLKINLWQDKENPQIIIKDICVV